MLGPMGAAPVGNSTSAQANQSSLPTATIANENNSNAQTIPQGTANNTQRLSENASGPKKSASFKGMHVFTLSTTILPLCGTIQAQCIFFILQALLLQIC